MNRKVETLSGKIVLILLLICVLNNPLQSGEKIKWYSFGKGSRISYKAKKPLLIFFHSESCVYCKKMLDESFGDQSVIDRLNKSYVPVILHLDSNEKNILYNKERISAKDLFFILEGSALPYIIFLDSSKGSIITTIPGFVKKSMFVPLLDYINEKCYEKKVSFQDYMGKRSLCKDL
jgi:thioredoxin-related protein